MSRQPRALPPGITRVTLDDDTVRWRVRVSAGTDPGTGKRRWVNGTFGTLKEAKELHGRVTSERSRGTLIVPRKLTVTQYLDEWFEGATRNARPSTISSYKGALDPVRKCLGARKLQELSKADVEGLVSWMLTEGRRRGGKAGTGLGPRSVQLTLGRLTAALDVALEEGLIVRNVAKLVTAPTYVPAERAAWTAEQVKTFKAKTSATRLYVCWLLAFYGLRRGEMCGLTWDDLNIQAKEVRVAILRTRTLVEGRIVEGPPKTKSSIRTLPVPDVELVAALRRLKTTQAAERLAAGEAYEDRGHLVVDELGLPVHPEWLSEEFERERKRAGLARIVLHGTRHTSATLLDEEGVPESDNALWHGHALGGRVSTTRKHYIHPDVERRLRAAGEVLAGAYRITPVEARKGRTAS